MNTALKEQAHIQTFRCSPRSNKSGATAQLYVSNDGCALKIEGSGAICAPRARFHAPWGKHTDQIKYVEIGEGITEIESSCFSSLKNLEAVYFP